MEGSGAQARKAITPTRNDVRDTVNGISMISRKIKNQLLLLTAQNDKFTLYRKGL